jgi:lipooligosaccharide transport system permease protein
VAGRTGARTLRVIEHQAAVQRRFWRGSVFGYLLNPVLFLAAMGFGVGGLVAEGTGRVDGVTYLAFVTPGLMAAAAMQTAAGESLWPVMAGMKWLRTYHAMIATPLGPGNVFAGIVTWTGLRATAGGLVFVTVGAALGGVRSPWAPLAAGAAGLTAAAFAAPLAAFAATQETDGRFPVIMRVGIVPLFLFSGTFFPVAQLPVWVRPARFASPLWYGVELARAATLGRWDPTLPAKAAALVAVILAAGAWGRRTFTRRLVQ